MGQVRLCVLVAIKEWLLQGGGGQDVLDDVQLFDALQTFLQSLPQHSIQQPQATPTESETSTHVDLEQARADLLSRLDRLTMRPPVRRTTMSRRSVVTRSPSSNPPDIDHVDAERLVDNLDEMAATAFNSVSEEVSRYQLSLCQFLK